MPAIARTRGLLAGCAAVLLGACGPSAEPAQTAVQPAPSAEAKARVLTPLELAHGRLRKAAADGDFVMVKALLDQGVNVNGLDPTDPQANTALHAAIDPGHFPVAKLLFQRGADLAAKNAAGETPLDLARKKNHEAIVVLLGMRPAGEAVPPVTTAGPVDPSKLDPGALIAKVGDILQNAQPAADKAKTGEAAAAEPAPAASPAAVAPQPAVAAPAAAAPAAKEEIPPELSQKKDELCGQITAAMGQLTDTEALAALEEAGISRDVALQQLAVIRATCTP